MVLPAAELAAAADCFLQQTLSSYHPKGKIDSAFLSGRQAMNLRELTRKVARNVGINLPAVQLFGKQVGIQ
jgi:hypothetical protein